jgi:hypothetical protein
MSRPDCHHPHRHEPIAFGTTRATELEPEQPERVIHRRLPAPKWVIDRLRANDSPDDILAILQGRLLSGESNLHEAQLIINDLGRRPGGAAAIKRFVTQEIITRLARR